MSDQNSYWVITSRAKGGANSPFGGSATANQTSQLVQMTEDQIRQEYQDSGQLQDKFGSFDSYMGYINDSQDFVQSAEWMMANPEYKTGSKEWAFLNGEDLAWKPGQKEQIGQKISQDRVAARTSAFEQWMGGEEGSALMEKYGIEPLIQNDDGDKFKWTGSGYQKTYKVDDHAGPIDYGKMLIAAGIGAGATPAIAGALGGIGGAALPAGVAGPAAPLIGGKLATGLAAGATNAATQGLLTGNIDPKSVLSSAVLAGVNPGGYVADNYAPWVKTDPFWGTKELAFGGAPPSSFYGGLISGSVNDVVQNGLVNGKFDLKDSLTAGLQSGAINSAMNTWDEWRLNSQDAIADRLQYSDPYKYGNNTETLINADGTRTDPAKLSNADLQKALADGGQIVKGRELAMLDALTDVNLNKTDFGALIGDDGLFSFIPRADLTGIRNITDVVGNGVDGLLNGFDIGDKQTIGLLNNPVVNGAAGLLGKLLPSGDGSLNEDLDAQKSLFESEWYRDNRPSNKPEYYNKSGGLTSAGVVAKWDYTTTKMDTLASFNFANSGGLNENYSWSENPRGQSELWGTMVGVPGLYSTGSQTSFLPNYKAGTISPPLKPDGTPVKPLNFGPEFTAQDYAEFVAEVDPKGTLLPSNDDSALRNWWLQQYYDYLQGDDSSQSQNTNTKSLTSTEKNKDVAVVDKNAVLIGGDDTQLIGGDDTQLIGGDDTQLAGGNDTQLAGGDDTQPAGGSTLPRGLPAGGRGMAIPEWTDLYGYTKISPYKKARLKVLAGMLSGIPGASMDSLALNFDSEGDPYRKIGMSDWDSGLERNT